MYRGRRQIDTFALLGETGERTTWFRFGSMELKLHCLGMRGEESVWKTGRSESKKGVTLGTVLRSEHWEVKCRGSM